jgi:serine/threonine protein kinase
MPQKSDPPSFRKTLSTEDSDRIIYHESVPSGIEQAIRSQRFDELIGQRLSERYVLGKRIGGHASLVCIANDLHLSGHPRVVKWGWDDMCIRVRREATLGSVCSRLPGIVCVVDRGEDTSKKIAYVMFELLAGQSLAEYLESQRSIPWSQALEICRKLGDAIVPLHEMGIVHRNIKPSNVFLCRNGNVKVLDLGLAVGPGMKPLPLYSVPLLENPFMSSELLADPLRVDPQDDIYSVAQILRYAIGGNAAMPKRSIRTTTNKKGQA